MTTFKVIEISDGETIKLATNFKWNSPNGRIMVGNTVKINGYSLPPKNTFAYNYAKEKLELLLKHKMVVLKNPMLYKSLEGESVICDIFIDNINVVSYFPEYRIK